MTNFIVGVRKDTGKPFLKMNFDKAYKPSKDFKTFKVYTNRQTAEAKLELLKQQ